MLSLIFFLLLGLALCWAAMVLYTAWMLTHPPRRTYASAVARGRPGDPSEMPTPREFRSFSFSSRGLTLSAWEIAGAAPDGPIVVMSHGWGDSKLGALLRLEAVIGGASRVVAWDLPGHGESEGVCSLGVAEVRDLRALLELLGEDRPVILYGWSLGAGVSIAVAREVRVAAVIAETPYRVPPTPARNVLRVRRLPHRSTLLPAFWLLRLLLGSGLAPRVFDRAELARGVRAPLLVMHGDEDEVCPVEDGRAIAQAAAAGRLAEIARGTHNRLWSDEWSRGRCEGAVREFLGRALADAAVLP
jgi:pimeloyl-ACP methyl ester carboxylesterase